MERKYPVLKCTKEIWDEIKSILIDWNITGFINISHNKWNENPYLLSNYGRSDKDDIVIGNSAVLIINNSNSLRYLVNTKEEFLEGIAKLLGKEYKPKKQFKKKYINKDNMERINIAEKLKNCPKGFKLYSKIHGNIELDEVVNDKYIKVTAYNINNNKYNYYYDIFGLYDKDFPDAECMLVPSKEQQDWNKFRYIEKGHRVMCSDDRYCWNLRCYVKDNLATVLSKECNTTANWKYIVPVEDFDFQAKDITDNIKKSII